MTEVLRRGVEKLVELQNQIENLVFFCNISDFVTFLDSIHTSFLIESVDDSATREDEMLQAVCISTSLRK
jgi:hypothetical protein